MNSFQIRPIIKLSGGGHMRTDLNELKNFLEYDFNKKMEFNPQYYKKAFARDLGISATALNEFLAGKRELSYKNINTVFRYINSRVHCSWCDRHKDNTKFLIQGPRNQYICNICVDKCNEIVRDYCR